MNMKFSTFLNAFIFLIVVCVQVFTIQYESDGLTSKIKYLVCLLGIFVGCITIFSKRAKPVMTYELGKVLQICLVFAIITIFFSSLNGQGSDRAGTELTLMILPIIYAFCLVNTLLSKQINVCMAFILIISMVAYLVSLHMGIGSFVSALLSVNPAESYSELESSAFSGVSIALALYYLYFRDNKICCILSILFVFFTFKRLAMLVVVFLIFIPRFIDCTKAVTKKTLFCTKILIMAISIGYFAILTPDVTYWLRDHWHFNLDQFTMARSWRFRLIYENPHYINTGLGSTWTFLHEQWGFSMEMDIVRLILEVTPLGAFLLINNMLDIAKKNRYCFIVMVYIIFNLITSHCLANMFSWLMLYLIIGTITHLDLRHHSKQVISIA